MFWGELCCFLVHCLREKKLTHTHTHTHKIKKSVKFNCHQPSCSVCVCACSLCGLCVSQCSVVCERASVRASVSVFVRCVRAVTVCV